MRTSTQCDTLSHTFHEVHRKRSSLGSRLELRSESSLNYNFEKTLQRTLTQFSIKFPHPRNKKCSLIRRESSSKREIEGGDGSTGGGLRGTGMRSLLPRRIGIAGFHAFVSSSANQRHVSLSLYNTLFC